MQSAECKVKTVRLGGLRANSKIQNLESKIPSRLSFGPTVEEEFADLFYH